jgi:phosphoribosylaminoimidazolecarboxamide formyltransferase/IMP cyclohydrolase
LNLLKENDGATSVPERKELARRSFKVSSHYDNAIFAYFNEESDDSVFSKSLQSSKVLRYGENPHQKGIYFGELSQMFDKISGKELSYNNLVDIDAAMGLMAEFKDEAPTFAILKHTNPCGLATRSTSLQAWKDALAGDPVSAFGGILICNSTIDKDTAQEIDKIFYEVLLAVDFTDDAVALLTKKKKRVLMKIKHFDVQPKTFKSLLNGVIEQDADLSVEEATDFRVVTKTEPTSDQIKDLQFANKLVKHLKSNTIVLAKDGQLLGMGCGQTSRVDACKQAISKAKHFKLDLSGCAMASDAFFPFPDCVQLGHEAGVSCVIQPGGSIKDQLSIDYCNEHGLNMVFTGIRHFKH